MITRYTPPVSGTSTRPQWRGACVAVAGGGPTPRICRGAPGVHDQRGEPSFHCPPAIDISSTAVHSHLNELSQQLARLEDGNLLLWRRARAPHAVLTHRPWHCRANAIAAATLPAEAQRRLTVMWNSERTGYRRPEEWPPRCPVAWLVSSSTPRGFTVERSRSRWSASATSVAAPLPTGRERAVARKPEGVLLHGPRACAARRGRADRAFR